MKRKIAAIMCCFVIALGVGTSIAYYNTKSFGFDENAKVVDYDNEKITFMDFHIYYDDISDFIEKVGTIIPDESRVISCRAHHNVVNI